MENEIIGTIKDLAITLATLVPVALFVIQQVKEIFKLENKRAEIFSLVFGFILAAAVAAVYASGLGFVLNSRGSKDSVKMIASSQ